MPGGLMGLLQLGKRSLQAHQFAQNVVGNNIGNVNTKGYARQRVRLTPGKTVDGPIGKIGSGVNIEGVERSRDAFVDKIVRRSNSQLKQWETMDLILQRTDAIFSEEDDAGIGSKIDQFFNSWYDLSNDPESQQARIAVRESGEALSNTMNRISRFVQEQRIDADQKIQSTVKQINAIAEKVAELNTRIPGVRDLSLTRSSELLDQRDRLLDDLSNLIDIRVTDGGKAGINVYVGSLNIVSAGNVVPIEMETSASGNVSTTQLFVMDHVEFEITGGEIKGLLDLRDENLLNYSNDLDTLASSIVEQVNTYHQVGYSRDGETGNNFFDNRYLTAGSIRLAPEITQNVNNIAAAAVDAVGDNTQALRIANLKDTNTFNGSSIRDLYGGIINQIGEDGYLARTSTDNYEIIQSQAQIQQEAVMGVSLDEEMIEMIKYEQAYQATARLIATADQMIQTLLSLK